MLEKILDLERNSFLQINHYHTPFLDQVMWWYSGLLVWLPFIVFFCFMLVYKKPKQEWMPVLFSILMVGILCAVVSSLITKPLFARPRPIFHPSFMDEVRTLYENITEPYGFVSGHSATTFGIAMFTSFLFRNKTYTCVIFLWALLMGYSRIYLGVHFISDVFAGALAGIGIGYLMYRIYVLYVQQRHSKREKEVRSIYPSSVGKTVAFCLAGYILFFSMIGCLWIKL